MVAHSSRIARPYFAYLVLITMIAGACTRPGRSNAPNRPQVAAVVDRTIFTDSALFRRVCTQADSGLTPRVGRCTPRDQAARIR